MNNEDKERAEGESFGLDGNLMIRLRGKIIYKVSQPIFMERSVRGNKFTQDSR